MLGDVVKLFLCRSCKGLFILDCQVEKHVKNCNGDPFKSPANLFACEREHFLELLAPSARNTAADVTNLVSNSKRKRRKSTPQTTYEAENRATGSSVWSRGDDTTRSSTSLVEMGTAHLDNRLLNTQTNKICRSHSQPQISPLQISVTRTDSDAVQCCVQQNGFSSAVSLPVSNSLSSAISHPVSNGFSSAISLPVSNSLSSAISHPVSNGFSSAISLPVSHSQPFTVAFTEGKHGAPCTSHSLSQEETNSDRPTSFPSNTNEEAYKNLACSDSDTDLIQKTGTPATNLLAFLSKLQQGVDSSAPQLTGHQEQPVCATVSQNCLQGSFSTSKNNAHCTVEDHPMPESEPPKNFAAQNSAHAVNSNGMSNQQLEQTVQVGGVELTENDDFHFQAVGVATFSTFSDTNYNEVGSEEMKSCWTANEILPVYSEDYSRVSGHETVNTGAVSTQRTEHMNMTSENECSKILQENGNATQDLELENTGETELYHSQIQSDCSASTAVHTVEVTGAGTGGETLPEVESTAQGPVVYILEPDGLFQNVAVENVATDNNMTANNSFVLPGGVGSEDVVGHSDIAVGDTLTVNITSSPTSLGSSPLEPVQVYVSVEDSLVKSENTVRKGKSKHQLRLEEQKALREKVLEQSTEVLPDAESNKTRYRCNICGHVAMSVKFMYNHLQMHSNGRVYFECDQCDYKCRQRYKMVGHQERHSRSRLLCHLCPATFMDMQSLNRHVTAKHTDSKSLKCDQCGFSASYANDLREHMLKHTGEMLCCDVEGCGYRTPYLRAFRSHQKRHRGEKNYKCSLCSFEGVEKHELVRHMRSHTQDRPYQCSSCHFRATTKYGVLSHMRHIHQQQMEFYMCDKCAFKTTYSSSMAKHLKSHMGAFTCPLCKHSFPALPNLQRHVQRVHRLDNVEVVSNTTKINIKDYLCTESEKPMMESLMTDTMNVDSQDLPPLAMVDMDRSRIDPMKLSFHFQDMAQGPFISSGSGVNLTRSSSIPDLFTFSGMNRSNSQSDLFTFSGINTMTRSNSMSDLVSFATSMCADIVEPVNMDVNLSDATAPSMDVSGLSLGDGPEVSLTGGARPGSPGGVVLGLQCSKCLVLLMNEEAVQAHSKTCTGTVQLV